MTTDPFVTYVAAIHGILQAIVEFETPAIRKGADAMASAIAAGGLVHVFGSGHSALVAHEIVGRAGGLVPVNAVTDPTGGRAERLAGYAAEVVRGYDLQYGLKPGEALIVISNSGINPLPIELALAAKERGLHVIAITNVGQSQAAASRHATGTRLFEVSDTVIDTHGVTGDAIASVAGLSEKAGAGSTIAGAMIVNLLTLATVEALIERSFEPPLLVSQNLPGTDERNHALFARYRGRLRQTGV